MRLRPLAVPLALATALGAVGCTTRPSSLTTPLSGDPSQPSCGFTLGTPGDDATPPLDPCDPATAALAVPPTTLDPEPGTPATDSTSFAVPEPGFVCVETTVDRIASATMLLDGTPLMDRGDFNSTVAEVTRIAAVMPPDAQLDLEVVATPNGSLTYDVLFTRMDTAPRGQVTGDAGRLTLYNLHDGLDPFSPADENGVRDTLALAVTAEVSPAGVSTSSSTVHVLRFAFEIASPLSCAEVRRLEGEVPITAATPVAPNGNYRVVLFAEWDGRDSAGGLVDDGSYFYRTAVDLVRVTPSGSEQIRDGAASEILTATVDNSPPVVVINVPAANLDAVFAPDVPFEGTITDDESGVAEATLATNGVAVPLTLGAGGEFSATATLLLAGEIIGRRNEVRVEAEDGAGNVAVVVRSFAFMQHFVQNQILVGLDLEAPVTRFDDIALFWGATIIYQSAALRLALFELPSSLSIEAAATDLEASPLEADVAYVDLSWIGRTAARMATPFDFPLTNAIDPLLLNAPGSALPFICDWEATFFPFSRGSHAVKVAVFDTGALLSHPDLVQNFDINLGEIPLAFDFDGSGAIEPGELDLDGDGLTTFDDFNPLGTVVDPGCNSIPPGAGFPTTQCGSVFPFGLVDSDADCLITPIDLAAAANMGDGTDADGNGQVDDLVGAEMFEALLPGFFAWPPPAPDPTDLNGHGTRVAGIIGARSDNCIGVAGVSPVVSMIPIKITFDDTVATSMGAYPAAIEYAVRRGAHIINDSGTGLVDLPPVPSPIPGIPMLDIGRGIAEAVRYAERNGLALVTAAADADVNHDSLLGMGLFLPGTLDLGNVLMVTAFDIAAGGLRSDGLPVVQQFFTFGGSGFGANTVDIAAPGNSILGGAEVFTTDLLPGPYSPFNGTSAATPHCGGAEALLYARRLSAGLTTPPSLLHAILKETAVIPAGGPLPVVSGGVLNVFDAVLAANEAVAVGVPATTILDTFVNHRRVRDVGWAYADPETGTAMPAAPALLLAAGSRLRAIDGAAFAGVVLGFTTPVPGDLGELPAGIALDDVNAVGFVPGTGGESYILWGGQGGRLKVQAYSSPIASLLDTGPVDPGAYPALDVGGEILDLDVPTFDRVTATGGTSLVVVGSRNDRARVLQFGRLNPGAVLSIDTIFDSKDFTSDVIPLRHGAHAVALSPDGTLLVVGQNASAADPEVLLIDITDPANPVVTSLEFGDDVNSVDISANGTLIAIGGRGGLLRLHHMSDVLASGAGAPNLLDVVPGDPDAGVVDSIYDVNKVAFSFGTPGSVFPVAGPSESFLFAFAAEHRRGRAGNGRVFQIDCDVLGCEVIGVRADTGSYMQVDGTSVAFSPDSRFVAFGGENFLRIRFSLTFAIQVERIDPNVTIFPIEVP